ncbi:histidine phosphatase family protein, partial [Mesorhizobium sp. M1D.F.Ca.ET.183.01.1.1]
MKQLLVLRHAKSSWDDPKLDDFDRPLGPRGLKTAPLMGREMARRGWLPELALVSPALRTRDT